VGVRRPSVVELVVEQEAADVTEGHLRPVLVGSTSLDPAKHTVIRDSRLAAVESSRPPSKDTLAVKLTATRQTKPTTTAPATSSPV
jgi:hypothetical protein